MKIPKEVWQIQLPGQSVTFERSADSPTGWCATAWQQGLPVARKQIPEDAVRHILSENPGAIYRER
jgi:hypothetical protein